MRGKGHSNDSFIHGHGITPAYAGKSHLLPLFGAAYQDHPRLCGEKYQGRAGNGRVAGSPPPMRGKAKQPVPKNLKNRITPAYAGKSETRQQSEQLPWDHPRLCGEKF